MFRQVVAFQRHHISPKSTEGFKITKTYFVYIIVKAAKMIYDVKTDDLCQSAVSP